MLRLKYETECWREALLDTIVSVESEIGVDNDIDSYDDCADEFCILTLQLLADGGVDYERAYQQSRGSFVIVQGGSEAEVEAFDDAMHKATDHVRDSVVRTAKSLSDCLKGGHDAQIAKVADSAYVEADEVTHDIAGVKVYIYYVTVQYEQAAGGHLVGQAEPLTTSYSFSKPQTLGHLKECARKLARSYRLPIIKLRKAGTVLYRWTQD